MLAVKQQEQRPPEMIGQREWKRLAWIIGP
jgi:hypothetical protein